MGKKGKSYMFVNLGPAWAMPRPAFTMPRPLFARLRPARATSITTDQSQTMEKDTLGEIITEKEPNVCFL